MTLGLPQYLESKISPEPNSGCFGILPQEQKMKLPVASHTFLNDWTNCPHKAFRKYIKKDLPKFVQTDAMKWGNEVHSAFEVRIRHGTKFTPEMAKFEAIAAPLVAAGAVAEKMLGITVDGRLCDFFAPDVWLRGKIDSTVIPIDDKRYAAIFDWKTGKRREEKAELLTHAVLLKAWQPTVQKVTAHYVWLQDNEVGKAHDVSDTETKLNEIRSTMDDVARCISDQDFPKRPNPLCGGEWGSCPVEDCEFRRGPRK
jgi:PD-(D/E)XK nuclease superfamily